MSSGSKIATILSITAIVVSVIIGISFINHKQKTAYVVIQELFENFELKKELEKQYTGTRNARKKILDSLQIDLSVLSKRLSSNSNPPKEEIEIFERKKIEFNQKMQEYDQSNVQLTKEFDDKIILQLNQYISEYGKENGYSMIFGNTSNGSIMYGDEKNNITKEVSTYINQKYKGLK
ncbi:MAG: OmpH family outer membrane protein [Bacteroidetes bacterium]|nr:OmpH family outer membrane protein [Bacteroidota bacterium]